MDFTNLCLVLTDKCNAECEFCCFSCSPHNSQVMPEELMIRAITEAKELGVTTVGFSGGECFLYPALLLKGAEEARKNGLSLSVATNGFWGCWDTENIKQFLTDLRPDFVGFSRDFFHAKYIPQESYERAFGACTALGIRCETEIADFNGAYSAGRYLFSLGEKKYMQDCRFYAAYRAGRALRMPEELFLTYADSEHAGCLYDGQISVFYNGDVYPCCRHEVYGSAMKLGTMKDKPLQQVVAESDVTKIGDVILNCDRMSRLVEIARTTLGYAIPEKMGCSCDFCRAIFGTEARKKEMLPYVNALYEEMLVNAALHRNCRKES